MQTLPDSPELPSLRPGITHLETEDTTTGPLQSLVLDHLLFEDGPALWVDGRGDATTQLLGRITPSKRILERVKVARGFTAYQHFSLIERLDVRADEETALVVAPALDHRYADEDLSNDKGERMLSIALERLRAIADEHDTAILTTAETATDLSTQIETAADRTLTCTATQFGPRFSGPEFESLVYRVGGHLQTTLAFWERILESRVEAADIPTTEVGDVGAH